VPAGQELSLELLDEIEARLAVFRADYGPDCPAEYTFANLYLFRRAHQYRYVPDRLCPRIEGHTYDGVSHVMPLVPLRRFGEAELRRILGDNACFFPIAEQELGFLDAATLRWSAQRSDSDYLYAVGNFIDYRGSRLRKRRNLMQQLLAQHELQCRPLAADSLPDAQRILRLWLRDKGKAPGEADAGPCQEALEQAGRLGLQGQVYYASGAPAGFILVEALGEAVQVVRFAKGSDNYKGIYPYMFHQFCSTLGGGIEWLNFEQDLGLENFRQAKLSYQPQRLLPKYRVVPV
jgi:hypothetical protein